MKKGVFILLAIVLLLSSLAAAGVDDDAGGFLRGKLDAVLAVLKASDMARDEKEKRAIGIIMPVFDMPLMAKLSVGKQFWPRFTDEQKRRFTRAFTRRLQQLYIGKIMLYSDERILFGTPAVEGNKARIPTELISKGSRYAILYKMYRSDAGWQIYDIELDRVSILKSFHSQTRQVLSNGSFQELIEKLESTPSEKNG